MNNVNLIGRLTKDPELNYTQTGQPGCRFSIAVNKVWKDKDGNKKEKANFLNCVAWGKTAELVAQYVKKGQQIAVSGELDQYSYEVEGNKKTSLNVVVKEVTFLK
jgi:single-strand DNA-binding protein